MRKNVRTIIKFLISIVPGLKRNIFSSVETGSKGVKTVIAKAGSTLDLGSFSIQLTRSDNFDRLNLAIAKESKRTESVCCVVLGETFGNETVLTASVPEKPIFLSAISMNID